MISAPPHRSSAVRRFPPGCGRRLCAAVRPQPPPPSHHPNTLPPNPSAAGAATKAILFPPSGQLLPAAAFPGTEAPHPGAGNGSVARTNALAVAAAAARRPSAVRRYPPGCGRGAAAASKPGALMGEGEGEGEACAGKPQEAACNGGAKAIAGDQKAVLREITLDHGASNANGGEKCGDGGGVQGNGAGLIEAPFLPWARHGRRSLRRKL